MMMVVKKPSIDVAFAQRSLYSGEVHGQTSIVNKGADLGESRRIFRRRKTYRAKQNGPGCPEPLKSMGCSTLSKDSVGWRVDACQVTGRLSLHFLPELVSTRTYSPRRMDLTGFEPASATWIECRVAVTPQARIALSGIKAPTAKTCRYKLTVMFQNGTCVNSSLRICQDSPL